MCPLSMQQWRALRSQCAHQDGRCKHGQHDPVQRVEGHGAACRDRWDDPCCLRSQGLVFAHTVGEHARRHKRMGNHMARLAAVQVSSVVFTILFSSKTADAERKSGTCWEEAIAASVRTSVRRGFSRRGLRRTIRCSRQHTRPAPRCHDRLLMHMRV